MVRHSLILVNLPATATLGETVEEGYITPNPTLALVTGYLLGFSDACFSTQVRQPAMTAQYPATQPI